MRTAATPPQLALSLSRHYALNIPQSTLSIGPNLCWVRRNVRGKEPAGNVSSLGGGRAVRC